MPFRDMPAEADEAPRNRRKAAYAYADLIEAHVLEIQRLAVDPRTGGAIQLANLPGSITRPIISDCTNF